MKGLFSDRQLLPHMDVLMARERMEAWSGQPSTVNFLTLSAHSPHCLDLPPRRREHELDEFLGDLGLVSLGVAFVDPRDISNYPPVLAVGIHRNFRLARPWEKTPRRAQFIQTRAVVNVTAFGIDDFPR